MTSVVSDRKEPLLRIEGLTKNFAGQFALNGVSFDLHRGEILGLIGPNGAGKTTLLETLAGILPADDGRITSEGNDIPQHRRRQTLFYVPDGVRPYGEQYVLQVLSFIAHVFRRSQKDVEQTVAAAGLKEVLGKRVNSLSKGFSRRLLLALGFLAPQPVLLMDEPFDGFDLRQAREMMPVLRGMASGGRTLLLSIHQMTDAERVCDRFVLLADGTVRGAGTLEELRSRTALPNRTFGGDLPCAHVRHRREDRYARCSPRNCARSRAAAPFGSCFSCSADWSDSASSRRRNSTARRVPLPRIPPACRFAVAASTAFSFRRLAGSISG